MGDDRPESDPERRLEDLERENRVLTRKLARVESNMVALEQIQDNNSKLLTRLMRELEEERATSHRLLLNVLPQRIIDRLEAGETTIADRYDDATVLMSDIVGFTEMSTTMPAEVVVSELNELFSEFDRLCERTEVEKIKTIGDAYMAVGGLPGTRSDHVAAVTETALEMVDVIARVSSTSEASWRLRIGIHTGPVAAGVIGTQKFAYDVWGDTVNVASRLESSSLPDRIHVSQPVADRQTATARLEPRGEVELKGKGAMTTYFLAR